MRAEEIIADLWRQIRDIYEAGKKPAKVILSPENYRRVQEWHAALGELPDPSRDYISKYSIFHLPVFVDSGAGVRVEAKNGR
jgi:hypothetical protein